MKWFLLTLFLSTSALAQVVPPAIDMTQPLVGESGKPAKDGLLAEPDDKNCDKCPVMTLGHAISHALNADYKDEPPEQKWPRGALAARVKDERDSHLSAEEITVIKRIVQKAWPPYMVAQIIPMLDPNAKPPELK